jgi:CCR4-NOT transcription complex subunit 9
VCNALALLQCVASHPDTRTLFLNAHVPLFLYPFLNTASKTRPFEYLRLTSLGVIGALVKMDDSEVINFLLSTEIIPLCLRIMETGLELSKTVATFIVQKILLDEMGLNYICATAERFYAVSNVLSNMVAALVDNPSVGRPQLCPSSLTMLLSVSLAALNHLLAGWQVRLLKHIVRCYLRLSDNHRCVRFAADLIRSSYTSARCSSVRYDSALLSCRDFAEHARRCGNVCPTLYETTRLCSA